MSAVLTPYNAIMPLHAMLNAGMQPVDRYTDEGVAIHGMRGGSGPAVLDIAPTATMYALTDKEFATHYCWWFFLVQPAPLPERLIAGDMEFFLRIDADDASARIAAPLLALWGAKGTVGAPYDVLGTWREQALRVRGAALDCGHVPQGERPHATAVALIDFLTEWHAA